MSGPFIADYVVWSFLIVEAHLISYDCLHLLHSNIGGFFFFGDHTISPYFFRFIKNSKLVLLYLPYKVSAEVFEIQVKHCSFAMDGPIPRI